MSKKRFTLDNESMIWDNGMPMTKLNIVVMLNEQQEEIAYWKHKVSSLLWILGQFDEQKVKKLLEELDE